MYGMSHPDAGLAMIQIPYVFGTGTDPKDLSQTARSPIRLSPNHSHTVFRVDCAGLKAETTY